MHEDIKVKSEHTHSSNIISKEDKTQKPIMSLKTEKKVKKDYYGILKVGMNCTRDDLRNAYRKLAMKWHPFKNLLNREKASIKFNRISEAYEV